MVDGFDKTFLPALQIVVGLLCILTAGAVLLCMVALKVRPQKATGNVLSGFSYLAAEALPECRLRSVLAAAPAMVRAQPPPSDVINIDRANFRYACQRNCTQLF